MIATKAPVRTGGTDYIRSPMADRIHVALFTPGYPYVDAALRAAELATRHGATFSRSLGEPASLHRDTFARWFVTADASHALMLEGDVVPPEDIVERLLTLNAPVATALYPQWADGRLTTNVQGTQDATWSPTVPPGVFSARRCLLGCVLVKREVFTRLKAPWFLSAWAGDRYVPDDEWFCNAVRGAGFGIRCDGSALCKAFRMGTELLSLTGGSLHAAKP
jgi:hypothetical protein